MVPSAGLLESGYTDFLRVGPLRRISRRLLGQVRATAATCRAPACLCSLPFFLASCCTVPASHCCPFSRCVLASAPQSLHASDSKATATAVAELREMLKEASSPEERAVVQKELAAAERGGLGALRLEDGRCLLATRAGEQHQVLPSFSAVRPSTAPQCCWIGSPTAQTYSFHALNTFGSAQARTGSARSC